MFKVAPYDWDTAADRNSSLDVLVDHLKWVELDFLDNYVFENDDGDEDDEIDDEIQNEENDSDPAPLNATLSSSFSSFQDDICIHQDPHATKSAVDLSENAFCPSSNSDLLSHSDLPNLLDHALEETQQCVLADWASHSMRKAMRRQEVELNKAMQMQMQMEMEGGREPERR